MKKKTFLAITASVVFAATIVSCGSDTAKNEEHTAEEHTAEEAATEVEEVTEEVVEETAATIDGSELFTSSGCVACHQAEVKTVGPSIKEIKEAYADNSDGLSAFLNGEADAIVDVAQAAVMAPQVETTKAMTAEERAAITDYLMK